MKRPLPPSDCSDVPINLSLPDRNDKLAGIVEISANIAERQRTQAELLEAKRFLRATLDTLAAPLAIINERGTVIEVNAAWNTVAATPQFIGSPCGLGENYLIACDMTSGNLADEARALAAGLRTVLAGPNAEFQLQYQGHSPAAPRWFEVRVTRFIGDGPVRAVITHENITGRKQTELLLTQTRQQMLEASRQAGLAEVATGVLHNVGNVLNSVNVAASYLADNLKRSKVANLNKVVALLREHEPDLEHFLTHDEKGKNIPLYLAQLGEHLATEQTAALQELDELQKNIAHIKDIVSLQQGYAKMSGLAEPLAATDLVADALKMNATSFRRHDIKIVQDFAATPLLTVEKHKALQILVNLLRNAMQACDDSGRAEKILTLRIAQTSGRVRLAVSDNGVGIPAENLKRIFSHGFTTKKDGHGFGLHSCALAAKEMGGALTVHSAGPGFGATFTLELPLALPQ